MVQVTYSQSEQNTLAPFFKKLIKEASKKSLQCTFCKDMFETYQAFYEHTKPCKERHYANKKLK
jgi:hypothetical protein